MAGLDDIAAEAQRALLRKAAKAALEKRQTRTLEDLPQMPWEGALDYNQRKAEDASVQEGMGTAQFLDPRTGQMTTREQLRTEMPDRGRLDASVAGGMQGNTFGWGDEFAGVVGGGVDTLLGRGSFGDNYRFNKEFSRADLEAARERHGGAALTGELAGALTAPVPAAPGAGMARLAGNVGLGAGIGAIYGSGASEDAERGQGAKTGAVIGAGVSAVAPIFAALAGRGIDAVRGAAALRKAAKGAPSTDELRRIGRAGYDAVEQSGVQIKPQAFKKLSDDTVDYLRTNTGFDELPGAGSLTPKSARVVEIMKKASELMEADPTAALPFKSLDQMRRQAGAAAADFGNKTDQAAGSAIIAQLDDFVKSLKPSDVLAGDVKALRAAIPKARELWARMSRSQLIDDAMEKVAVAGPGSALRNQFKRILNNPKLSRGFTEAEKSIMEKVATGTAGERIMRFIGSGIGLPVASAAGATLGAAAGGGGSIIGATMGAVTSAAARRVSERILQKRSELVRAIVANGGLKNLPELTAAQKVLLEALVRKPALSAASQR